MAQDEKIRVKVETMVKAMARALQLGGMYGEKHKLTEEAVDELYRMLSFIFEEREEVTVGIIGKEIAFEKEPFYDLSVKIEGFLERLKELDVKKISFSRGIDIKELTEFTSILNMKSGPSGEKLNMKDLVRDAGLVHISLGELGFGKAGQSGVSVQDQAVSSEVEKKYNDSVEFFRKTYENVKGNQPMNVSSARQMVDGMIQDVLKNRNLLLMLTSIKGHDEGTFAHGVNVTIFTLMQAEALGLDSQYLPDVGMASLLHDIGKLSVPREVLQKEEEEMRKNGQESKEGIDIKEEKLKKRAENDIKGAKLLLENPDISVLAAIVAFEHNINYDMSGYPKKLYGSEKLNLISMMISISDYYGQLRGKPGFYEESGPEKAYKEMMELSGTKFHPDLLKNFFSMVGVYPPGTLVELDTKEAGLVIQSSMLDMRRPQVEILYDEKGEKIEEPEIINLLEKDKKGKFKWTIVKSLVPLDGTEMPEE